MRLPPSPRSPKSSLRRATAVAIAMTALLCAASADAQPEVLRPSTRPMFFTAGIGPSIGLSYNGTQTKLAQDFGYHFFGEGDGPALGAELSEAFGRGVFRFQVGAKFWWDIQPSSSLGLYLAPTAQLGFGHLSAGSATAEAFDAQFGFEVRLVLGDRGMVYVRPLGIDVLAGGNSYGTDTATIYDLMIGGGVTF